MNTKKLGIKSVGAKRYAFTKTGTHHFKIKDVHWADANGFKLSLERAGIGEVDARECLPGGEEIFDFGIEVRSGDEMAIWVKHPMGASEEGGHIERKGVDPKKHHVEFYSGDFWVVLNVD